MANPIIKSITVSVKKNKGLSLFFICFLLAEIIVNPLGKFPLNDDWAYATGVSFFNERHYIFFGDFPSMTLFTHIIWGSLFTYFTGFSFFALRVSTIISAIIGFIFLNKLVTKLSGNKTLAVLACAVLLFNPIFFNLANTFMTDVNFSTLWIICCYLAYNYFQTDKKIYYFFFIVGSCALILIRQYGIVLPACFMLVSPFAGKKRILSVILGISGLAITIIVLKYYENYLRDHLPEINTYKFSGNVQIFEYKFWSVLGNSFMLKYKEIILQILVFTAPFAVVFSGSIIKKAGARLSIIVFVNSLVLVLFFLSGYYQTSANIFSNLMIGPESFHESFNGARHNLYPRFETLFHLVKILFSVISLFVISTNLILIFPRSRLGAYNLRPILFFAGLIVSYIFMILITESYFDRYHLPLIITFIIALSWINKNYDVKLLPAIIPLVFFAYISVAGTKDYMAWNNQRWKAYRYLKDDLKIPIERINGGFEVNCYRNGVNSGWQDFLDANKFDYLIQFNPAKGFVLYKEYQFNRYLPFKKDKVNIYVKEGVISPSHAERSETSLRSMSKT
jgi:hypothetical protein